MLCMIVACVFLSHAQPMNNYLKDYIPNNPTAAAFAKDWDIPVSTFNGQASISVPIASLKHGGLMQNVGIAYNTGGIRVEETATCVGLGWRLNAGDMITREIRGLADETPTIGYADYASNIVNYYLGNANCGSLFSGNVDLEPDEYNWSAGKYNGKFIVGVQYPSLQPTIVNTPATDCKITKIGSTWRITTPEGDVYHFNTFDTNGTYNGSTANPLFERSSWM
jgi:hypothetical protein